MFRSIINYSRIIYSEHITRTTKILSGFIIGGTIVCCVENKWTSSLYGTINKQSSQIYDHKSTIREKIREIEILKRIIEGNNVEITSSKIREIELLNRVIDEKDVEIGILRKIQA